MQRIDDTAMTNQVSRHFTNSLFEITLLVIVLVAGFSVENRAQIKPSMKIKLDVLPSVNVARMDGDLQTLFTEDIAHLNELASARIGGEDLVSLDFGFSVSAYENITVLLSFTKPELSEKNKHSLDPMRIVCGYLNDGTTYFKRATITNKNSMQFRLRNNNLLKRSMKLGNPLFVAYAFFLVSHETGTVKKEGPLPVSTITLEFM
jgi:hypothetical protein